MITWLVSKGVGTDLIRVLPNHTTGLYIVEVDNSGERHFVYHRGASAARRLFSDPCTPAIPTRTGSICPASRFAVLNAEARRNLCDTLDNLRTGGAKIAFDTTSVHDSGITWTKRDAPSPNSCAEPNLVLPPTQTNTPSSAIQLLSTPLSGCIGWELRRSPSS